MASPPLHSTERLEEQATLIAGEIFNLINEYTNDSNISKFFLTDEIAHVCYGLAGGFASVIYDPPLAPENLQNTQILSFIYALITYGFNMYLKERSLKTNASPYSLPTERQTIKSKQKKVLLMTSQGKLVSTPLADKIIELIIKNIKNQIEIREFAIKKHRFNKTKFWDYTKLSLYWGYNFSQLLVAD